MTKRRKIEFNVTPKTAGRGKGIYHDVEDSIDKLRPQDINVPLDDLENFRTPVEDEIEGRKVCQAAGRYANKVSSEWKVKTHVEYDFDDREWFVYVRKVWREKSKSNHKANQPSMFDPGASGQRGPDDE